MPDLTTLLIVCPLVFLGGLVDSIAGGGGIITLPAYLMAGVPAHMALATNKASSSVGTLVATARLARGGYIDVLLALPAVACALVGSPVGARMALLVPEGVFRVILMVALPLIAVLVLREKTLHPQTLPMSRRRRGLVMAACALACGCYDGFYGPGTGTFLLLCFSRFAGLGVRDASGQTKAVNLASNVAALVTFALSGQIWWSLGLIAGVFGIAGNYIGAGLVLRGGIRAVRPIIAVVLAALFVKTALELAGVM